MRGLFERFVEVRPIFALRELHAKLLAAGKDIDGADRLIQEHLDNGVIVDVADDVYAVVPPGLMHPERYEPHRFLVASLIRGDGVLAFNSALQMHGLDYSGSYAVKALSAGDPGYVRFLSNKGEAGYPGNPISMEFVKCNPENLGYGVETVSAQGIDMKVTTVERTIVDCMQRPDLAGGLEELRRAMASVERVSEEALIDIVVRKDDPVIAGLVGYWLETSEFFKADIRGDTLSRLERLCPDKAMSYAGAEAGKDFHVGRWNLWLPGILVEPDFDSSIPGLPA